MQYFKMLKIFEMHQDYIWNNEVRGKELTILQLTVNNYIEEHERFSDP